MELNEHGANATPPGIKRKWLNFMKMMTGIMTKRFISLLFLSFYFLLFTSIAIIMFVALPTNLPNFLSMSPNRIIFFLSFSSCCSLRFIWYDAVPSFFFVLCSTCHTPHHTMSYILSLDPSIQSSLSSFRQWNVFPSICERRHQHAFWIDMYACFGQTCWWYLDENVRCGVWSCDFCYWNIWFLIGIMWNERFLKFERFSRKI